MTSTKELRQRLATFLAEPEREQDFRAWFALVLRDAHKSDPATETLAHDIMWAFYDQRRGLCAPEQLTETLVKLATDSYLSATQLSVETGASNGDPQGSAATLQVGAGCASVPA